MGLTHSHFAWDLHAGEKHLAHLLKGAGYDTALVGIQHETNRPQDMGWNTIVTRDAPPPSGETAQTGAHAIAGNAVQTLNRLAGGHAPFYLQVGFFEPHRAPGTPASLARCRPTMKTMSLCRRFCKRCGGASGVSPLSGGDPKTGRRRGRDLAG
jgi:hypothetical protein